MIYFFFMGIIPIASLRIFFGPTLGDFEHCLANNVYCAILYSSCIYIAFTNLVIGVIIIFSNDPHNRIYKIIIVLFITNVMIIGLNGSLLFSYSYYQTKGIFAYVLLSLTRFLKIITERKDSEDQDEFRSIIETIFIDKVQ